MERRELISLVGASTIGLAGCTSTQTGRTSERDGTDKIPTSSENPDPKESTITFDALQPAIVQLQTDDLSVSDFGQQYLYFLIDIPNKAAPPRKEFSLQFDGRRYNPVGSDMSSLYRMRKDQRYTQKSGEGWILFRLPETGDADETRLTGAGGKWEPTEPIRERLAKPEPDLQVSVTIPETVKKDTQPTINITVQNQGTIASRFVAGLSRKGPSIARRPVALISQRVEADSKAKIVVTDDSDIESVDEEELGDGNADMSYHLNWTEDAIRSDVRIKS